MKGRSGLVMHRSSTPAGRVITREILVHAKLFRPYNIVGSFRALTGAHTKWPPMKEREREGRAEVSMVGTRQRLDSSLTVLM